MPKVTMSSINEVSVSSVQHNSNSNASEVVESDSNQNVETHESDAILCVLWKNGKLGSAYYKINDQQLYILRETVDPYPQFAVTRALYREVDPRHTITIGSVCDGFVKTLIDTAIPDDEDTVDSEKSKSLPPNISLLNVMEYSFDACLYKVNDIVLPSAPVPGDMEREIFLHSLIDFESKVSVHALGALIKFTQKNWAHLSLDETERLQFLHINKIAMTNHVLIDRTTFCALQLFESRKHDASFKHGRNSSNREGLSVFKLLSQYCKSKLGFVCLRNLLLSPVKDICELNKRLDFIAFTLIPANQGFIESLQDHIKRICDVQIILRKIQYSRADSRDWENLYNAVYNILFLHELCGPYRTCAFLSELDSLITPDLYGIEQSLKNALDFAVKDRLKRPVIKFGLDQELDAKKLRCQDINKNVTAAAKFAVNVLPEFLTEWSVVYIPEMGHLIAVTEWEENCDRNQLQNLGFQFMFEVHKTLHYKNAMCIELDEQMGDIYQDILAHENRILKRLSEIVLRFNKDIREPLRIIGVIDCLISMAKVAKEKGYVRPTLNDEQIHEIEEGRHPLLEIGCVYVPNDFCSGDGHSHMKIITGPNASGKSIYLKQTALIVFLAHVGSYVPAKRANIGMVHSIHLRIHSSESSAVRLSAFMIDVSQMSQALHNANSSSLVLIDEFGRGTTHEDGPALLASALKKFLDQDNFCPHVIVSTHFQRITELIPVSPLVNHMKMDFVEDESSNIVFLYKVIEGVSRSYAFEAALAAGLDAEIVNRAKEIYQAMMSNRLIPRNTTYVATEQYANSLCTNVYIPEPDDD